MMKHVRPAINEAQQWAEKNISENGKTPGLGPSSMRDYQLVSYQGCGLEGDAKGLGVQALNRLKNRYRAPRPEDINPSISLKEILRPGNDSGRWKVQQGGVITGYVADVKPGGIESTNCHAHGRDDRDTHLELVLDPMAGDQAPRMIVEVTPRWRHIMKAQGVDWSSSALRARYLGRWVRIGGWMLFDSEHRAAATNTAYRTGPSIWRATAWEIHPITAIELIQGPRSSER